MVIKTDNSMVLPYAILNVLESDARDMQSFDMVEKIKELKKVVEELYESGRNAISIAEEICK